MTQSPDVITQSQDQQQAVIDNTLACRVVYQGISATECTDCGDAIPEARQKAIPGCTTCVICKALSE